MGRMLLKRCWDGLIVILGVTVVVFVITRMIGDPVDIITIGQYLQPTRNHLPIDRWVDPAEFLAMEEQGKAAGIKVVFSGPLVRSSYLADAQAEMLAAGGGISTLDTMLGRPGRSA